MNSIKAERYTVLMGLKFTFRSTLLVYVEEVPLSLPSQPRHRFRIVQSQGQGSMGHNIQPQVNQDIPSFFTRLLFCKVHSSVEVKVYALI